MTKTKTTLTDKERKAFATIGRMGGLKNAKKGKKYMSEIGKNGANKRWAKKKLSTDKDSK